VLAIARDSLPTTGLDQVERESDEAATRCGQESVNRLIEAFGGISVLRRFLAQRRSLIVGFTFGITVNRTVPTTGEVVEGEPQVSFINYSERMSGLQEQWQVKRMPLRR
jgi:hypothetical protein